MIRGDTFMVNEWQRLLTARNCDDPLAQFCGEQITRCVHSEEGAHTHITLRSPGKVWHEPFGKRSVLELHEFDMDSDNLPKV
uniref:Uncharacterized protein n=1 Tax=Trichuris muris TaxID=70415 RepID=A0A5S6Q7A4_TRIMR